MPSDVPAEDNINQPVGPGSVASAEAIGVALDNAVMFGVGSPASYPPGGIVSAAYSASIGISTTGGDAVNLVSQAMSAVEVQGVSVLKTHAVNLVVKGALRGMRTRAALCSWGRPGHKRRGQAISAYRHAYVSFPARRFDFITGGWNSHDHRRSLGYGTEISAAGVIAGDAGKVIISGFANSVLTDEGLGVGSAARSSSRILVTAVEARMPFASAAIMRSQYGLMLR